jgi:hypothetical protein
MASLRGPELPDTAAALGIVDRLVAGDRSDGRPADTKKPAFGPASWSEMVGAAGFEPTTTSPPDWCATRLRHAPTHWRV